MFTIILIALGTLFVVVTVVNEIRCRRKRGHHIDLNAPSDDDNVNRARLIQGSNPHQHDHFGTGF